MFDHDETLDEARARNLRDALFEDIGRCDWTAQLVPAGRRVRARVIVREAAVLCGQPWFDGCVKALDAAATVAWRHAEGAWMAPNDEVCVIESDARALLSAERPALNFLQLLSGTATLTRRHVQAIEGASPTRAAAPCSTPARPCPACAWHRSTRCAWAAGRTSAWRSTTAS